MQASVTSDDLDAPSDNPERTPRHLRLRLLPPVLQPHALCVITTLIFFIADVVLPRGATPAIGYCLVTVLARTTRRRRFLVAVTGICTVLTWIGFVLEPAGAAWWMSVFDRGMVTGVLWLTLLLVWRRMEAERALAHQAQALRNVVRELHRSNAELESFASVVSHDIRGPLNSIALLIKIISTRPPIQADPECREYTGSIVSEICRVGGLIQRLLTYGRVGSGEVKRSHCDCQAHLASVRQALRAELESAGAQLTNDSLPDVCADPALIEELLQNLIENGIKYRGPRPPRIHVSATRDSDGWVFSVRDNGMGIRADDCARVFEPFYRGAGGEASKGAGLGLATCKRIVDRHGGWIQVQSSPGFGSTFTFLIPDAATTEDADAESAPPLHRPRIVGHDAITSG